MNTNEPPKDHVDEQDDIESDAPEWDDEQRSRATWQRLLFMIIMAMIFSIGVTVGMFVIVLQFLWVLSTGETKREFSTVGRQLAEYLRQIVLFMTFNTDERPFPFDLDWPSA